jgi:hypothetical protein
VVTEDIDIRPFVLLGEEDDDRAGVVLTDRDMQPRLHVFEERADEGWQGTGYDWTSVARVLVAEEFPQHESDVGHDPEAGMFFMSGPRPVLAVIAAELRRVFDDEARLRDLLDRAEPD